MLHRFLERQRMILFRFGSGRRLGGEIDQFVEWLPEAETEFGRRIVLGEQELGHENRLEMERNVEAVESVNGHDDHHFGDVVEMELGFERVFAGECDVCLDVFLGRKWLKYN